MVIFTFLFMIGEMLEFLCLRVVRRGSQRALMALVPEEAVVIKEVKTRRGCPVAPIAPRRYY